MTAPRLHVAAELLGQRFRLEVFPGLFCADRIDEGTRLLLGHLPEQAPAAVLDLGCGYGALGLPVAATHPQAHVVLVDRDLLAVEASARNAASHGLSNVATRGSLGYREVEGTFDWVLCNVPARIGDEGVRYLIGAGAARLRPGGELRVVVIRDLRPVVERACPAARLVAEGPRHLVFAHGPGSWSDADQELLYTRDIVTVDGNSLERPHDVSEDRSHVADAIPVLLDVLPRRAPGGALLWRLGYGAVAVGLARRGAAVIAADRDLLATTFTRRNALRAGVEIETREASRLAAIEVPRAPLVALELGAAIGEALGREELIAATQRVARGGSAYVLALGKVAREWIPPVVPKGTRIAARGAWEVWRLPPA